MPPDEPVDAPPQSITPDEGAAQLEALLEAKPLEIAPSLKRPTPSKAEKQPPGATAAPEAPEDAEEEEAAPDASQSPREPIGEPPVEEQPVEEEPGPDEQSEEDAERQVLTAEYDDVMVEMDIDGTPTPMPLKELREGYLRNKDYTQKTQKIAEERSALEEYAEQLVQEREVYKTMLPQLQQMIQQLMPVEPDWQALMQQDVGQYWVERARWEEQQRQLTAIQSEQQRVAQMQQSDMMRKLKAHLDRGRTQLLETFPAWKDEKVARADKDALRAYAKKSGFSDTEIDRAYDPRLVIWGHKARLYDQLTSKAPKPMRQAPGPAALRPGAASQQTAGQSAVTKAKRRVAQTHSVKDGVAALEAIIAARGI